MLEVALTIHSPEGTRRVSFKGSRLIIGRVAQSVHGAEWLTINDDGISRRQASINRDGDRLWVLDENSTNGTLLNRTPVPPVGTPLTDGDEIFIGNGTTIRLEICDAQPAATPVEVTPAVSASLPPTSTPPARTSSPLILVCIVGIFALVVVAAIASYAFSGGSNNTTPTNRSATMSSGTFADAPLDDASLAANDSTAQTTTTSPDASAVAPPAADESSVAAAQSTSVPALPLATSIETASYRGKRYTQMTPPEQMEFIEARAQHISRMMGNRPYAFNDDVLRIIKTYVDAYARRVGNNSRAMWGEDLRFMFERARTQYAPHISRAFNARGVPPVVGLYLVVVETEYRNIKSENFAGAAGLFQFIAPTARGYGVDPAERTNIAKMAPAAAHYLADRIGEFGPDSMSVALAIAGYNRSPDSVRRDLRDVLNSENKERSFWTLVANSDKLDHYFQNENIKYVPKFFAAAIVGETPEAFGLEMRKLSSYTTIDANAPVGEPVATTSTATTTTPPPKPSATPNTAAN